jgi:hypothetical protein
MKYKKPFDFLDNLELLCWLLLAGLSYFIDQHLWLLVPATFLCYKYLKQFSQDNKDLKNARNYFRLTYIPWPPGLNLVLIIISFELSSKFEILSRLKSPEVIFYLMPIVMIYIVINMKIRNFTSGFRWYISGIKLPGRRSLLIPYRLVSDVKREEGELFVTILGKVQKFKIHKSDRRAAEAFVRHYERITAPQD